MTNIIDFKTGDIPNEGYREAKGYDYEKLMRSLLILEVTKCVIVPKNELTRSKISYVKIKLKRNHNVQLRTYMKDGHYYLWVQK